MQFGSRSVRVICYDAEYYSPDGAHPTPHCFVFSDFETGETWRLWRDEFRDRPPFPTDERVLWVSYLASAEAGCHLAWRWPLPTLVLDLFVEFVVLTNGLPTVAGRSLLGALQQFGLDGIAATEKAEMRALASRGTTFTADERRALLDYCETDVLALRRLLPRMLPYIHPEEALLRGRYMLAAAQVERTGIPLDLPTFTRLRDHEDALKRSFIEEANRRYDVYDDLRFSFEKFAAYLERAKIPWPRTKTGRLSTKDEVFRDQARSYPELKTLADVRASVSQVRLSDFHIGPDGRNRAMVGAFGARTGRNAPRTSELIVGAPTWLRHVIQAPAGCSLAYVDYEQQEFGIAAILSGDEAMRSAYLSGDPYLAFAVQAGLAPPGATKASHPDIRERCKTAILATQYGQGVDGLARRLHVSRIDAATLLAAHRRTYARFWQWIEGAIAYASAHSRLHTCFGWQWHTLREPEVPKLLNWPMQSHGSETLRLAVCFTVERGVAVSAMLHDAILILAPTAEIDHAVAVAERAMGDASAAVLAGFRLRTEAALFHAPDRFRDARGAALWTRALAAVGGTSEVPVGGASEVPLPVPRTHHRAPSSSFFSSVLKKEIPSGESPLAPEKILRESPVSEGPQ